MTRLKNLLRNRNAILLLGLLCGLFIPYAVPVTRHFILFGLGLTMTLSTMEIGNDAFRSPRRILVPALIGIALNYLLLGSIQIGLSSLFISNEAIWTGLVLVAAVPPAIAIIPFSGILRANPTLSLFGTVGAHLAALAITPLIAISLLGATSFNPRKLLITLFFLIVVPLIASRVLICRPGIRERVIPLRGTITNWTFFFVFYTMVGLNRDFLLGKITVVLPIAAILLTTTFALGFLIDRVGILFHLSPETRTSLVLLGTLKNQANAGGLALTFFSQEAALPAAISSIIMMTYFMWLDFWKRRS
jgi:BASS family bile acid:Na+ symporter